MSLFDALNDDDTTEAMHLPLLRAIAIVPRIDDFFGQYLQSVSFEPRADLPAIMATDCVGKIFYNPARMLNEPNSLWAHPPFLACAIVHELMHIFRLDWEFCRGRDMRLANIALDAVINRDMINARYLWPRANEAGGFISPYATHRASGFIMSTDNGETAVDVYDHLKRDNENAQMPNGGDLDRETMERAVAEAGGAAAVRRMIGQKMAGAAMRAEAIAAAKTPEQKRADTSASQEAASPNHGGEDSLSDKVLSWFGLRSRRNVNPLANIAGSKIRQGMMSTTQRRRRSLTVPSPMTDLLGYVVAGRKRFYDIRPAFAFDISGSISREDVHRAGGEANTWSRGMVGSLAQIPVSFFNTRVVESGSLNTYRNSSNIPEPTGGTNFIPAFQWMMKLPRRPTHFVIWTDCFGDFPDPASVDRNVKLVVVITPTNKAALAQYEPYMAPLKALGATFIESQ